MGGPLCEIGFGVSVASFVKGIDSDSIWVWSGIFGCWPVVWGGVGIGRSVNEVLALLPPYFYIL